MGAFRFDAVTIPPEAEALRAEVRAFLAEELTGIPEHVRAGSWSRSSAAFSAKLAARGWVGMAWSKEYGGHERSFLERYVVLEELLAAGAPVGAHWIADRQSAPSILKFGTEAQKRAIVPRVARGEVFFCIGMSEPDSGSDLAATRARAEKTADGWLLNGTKLWTSGAKTAHYMIGLFRTSTESKHGGLTQFLIDMTTPGITVRPIRDLTGDAHFNEVTFEDVRLPADAVLGGEGQGWAQVTSELAFERSGPERFLSSMRLVVALIGAVGPAPNEKQAAAIGRLTAHLVTLRRMSVSVAGMLARKEDPALEAAVVKDLGAVFEQEIPQIAAQLIEAEPTLDRSSVYERVLAEITMISPSFSLRGGTREILRGIIARGLGLR
ncbi:MAG: acyl-CoA dehydrogenase family protein [Alphaproteobacteria bacterium]|nr:acyl-CoA dehydrogenase family protein [Alphaproteobacteria bacterium]